jgi:glyoxylase-like metal-dependent hydrolase (beta-lactamase superfamily II)
MFITLRSRDARAVFCGDILHQAIQIFHPEWNSFACEDAENARRSRRKVLEHCAGSGALLLPTHFGAPFVCRVDAKGDAFVPRFGA